LLASATSTSNYEGQADAALALSYVGDPVAVPFLRELLTAVPRVDAIVIEGLRRIGSPEALAVLDEATRSPDPHRAALARDAIRRIPTRR
jgi:HEAT repeat protein